MVKLAAKDTRIHNLPIQLIRLFFIEHSYQEGWATNSLYSMYYNALGFMYSSLIIFTGCVISCQLC